MNVILASASPRRIEMFRNAGYDPVVMPASIIEQIPDGASPAEATMSLALQKASAIRDILLPCAKAPEGSEYPSEAVLHDDTVIVAADTVVVLDGHIIGKPEDSDDAFTILSAMRNRSHHVITGCCILKHVNTSDGWETISFYEDTEVWFRDYSDEELRAYVETDEPYDKAGGYAIQGTFGRYIDHIDGDFDNVVGLPFSRVISYI